MSERAGERFRAVAERAARAAIRSGREPNEVSVVAAAKTFGVEAVRAVIAAGARDIGENYVQDARRKRAAVDSPTVRWHLIGRLQRNKARQAIELFDLIHSLDTLELARALDRAAAKLGARARCLVEVKLGTEPSKGGVSPDALGELLSEISVLSHLQIEGLMTIPPPTSTPEAARPFFAHLRRLRDRERLRLHDVRLKELSMGMSADFEIAIEEGATIVRVGEAIFGPRRKSP